MKRRFREEKAKERYKLNELEGGQRKVEKDQE